MLEWGGARAVLVSGVGAVRYPHFARGLTEEAPGGRMAGGGEEAAGRQVSLPGWPLGGSLTKPSGAYPRLTGTGNKARVVCAAPEVPGRGGGTLAGVSGDLGDLLGPSSVFESLCCPWPSACTSLRDRSSYKLSKAVPINPIPVV